MSSCSLFSSVDKDTLTNGFEYLFNNWTIDSILLKTTNLCTFNCNYCFWFRDKEVKLLSDFLTVETENRLISLLEDHVKKITLKALKLFFMGGNLFFLV